MAENFACRADLTSGRTRRYGFHGLSYEYIAAGWRGARSGRAAGMRGRASRERRQHVRGRGRPEHRQHDGFHPLERPDDGHAPGALDPGLIIWLIRSGHECRCRRAMLYRDRGLKGVSGVAADMRTLLASAGNENAQAAIDLFVYRVLTELGSLTAALGGIDGLVFTAGIGENDAATRRRLRRLLLARDRARPGAQATEARPPHADDSASRLGHADRRGTDDRHPYGGDGARPGRTGSPTCLRRCSTPLREDEIMNEKPTTPTRYEHSVPWFWPLAAGIEMEQNGLRLFHDNLSYLAEVGEIEAPKPPEWASANRTVLDLDTMRLRDFSTGGADMRSVPILVDPPYAGHSSTIADYAKGQSLVETLLASGLPHVLATDWKSATPEMRDFDIDKYLAELNVVVDDLGGRVALVGLCQGGWMSAMYASRFPGKVAALVLAGAPIDTDAGDGPIKRMAHQLPLSFYEKMVAAGGGRMLGQSMLAGWKNMHPGEQYLGKYLDLYAHIEDKNQLERTEHFESWYENPLDLPGPYYLQAIRLLFKENRFAKGEFVGLGRKLSLKDVHAPAYLLAGESDDITTSEQVFAAEHLLGTPPDKIKKKLVPGGHIGLFMSKRTLKEAWPEIAEWLRQGIS